MIYTAKKDVTAEKPIVATDMLLSTDMPTTAGSKMLEGYMSLLASEALLRLMKAGYTVTGKANVGEFGIDLLGETSAFGAIYTDGVLRSPAAEALKDAKAVIGLDVNGDLRRAAAQSGNIALKPTYGLVSRYGTVPVACSGETVSILAKTAADCRELLPVIAGHDEKDGTSLPDSTVKEGRAKLVKKKRVAILKSMLTDVSDDVKAAIDRAVAALEKNGIEVNLIAFGDGDLLYARAAWNILMSAEACNNVSRYDGVKYGYRAKEYSGIDELYTNSRTEAFGTLLKKTILFGSETLSTDNYQKVYDKALRVRRVLSEKMAELLSECDACLLPATSMTAYPKAWVEADDSRAFTENLYTSLSSITGLPAVVSGGVQLVGPAFSEDILLSLAEMLEGEGK